MTSPAAPSQMIAYLEDPPADTGSVLRGLSKAIVPLLHCLDDQIGTYFVHQTHGRLPPEQMPGFVRAKLFEGCRQTRLSRQAWRLPTVLPISLGLALASLFSPRPSKKMLTQQKTCLWVPVGIDPGTLVRARSVAKHLGLPLYIYLVDDIETHPANSKTPRLNPLITRILRDAARVYTITDELGVMCNARYGIKTRRLPLIPDVHKITAPKLTKEAEQRAPFAVYLGSINHLYEDGLRHLVDAVDSLREKTGQDLKLRFFSDPAAVRRLCGGVIPPWIVAGSEKDDAVVRHQIKNAALCFLPYSFSEAARTMVSTSFPSKLLDYLLGARAIVVFAPDYSIAYKTLSINCVPHVVSTPEALAGILAEIDAHDRTNQKEYRDLLALHFSCDIVKEALSAQW